MHVCTLSGSLTDGLGQSRLHLDGRTLKNLEVSLSVSLCLYLSLLFLCLFLFCTSLHSLYIVSCCVCNVVCVCVCVHMYIHYMCACVCMYVGTYAVVCVCYIHTCPRGHRCWRISVGAQKGPSWHISITVCPPLAKGGTSLSPLPIGASS